MSMFQDNDDLNIHDDGEDSPVASQGAWPAFSSAPALLTWRGRVSAIHFTVSGASSKLRLLT